MSKTGRPSPSLERHRDHLARHENVEASWPQRSLASFFPTTVPTALLHVPGEGDDDDVFLESPVPKAQCVEVVPADESLIRPRLTD